MLRPRILIASIVSLVAWLVFFYAVDLLVMEGQGLPVGWNLMPV